MSLLQPCKQGEPHFNYYYPAFLVTGHWVSTLQAGGPSFQPQMIQPNEPGSGCFNPASRRTLISTSSPMIEVIPAKKFQPCKQADPHFNKGRFHEDFEFLAKFQPCKQADPHFNSVMKHLTRMRSGFQPCKQADPHFNRHCTHRKREMWLVSTLQAGGPSFQPSSAARDQHHRHGFNPASRRTLISTRNGYSRVSWRGKVSTLQAGGPSFQLKDLG